MSETKRGANINTDEFGKMMASMGGILAKGFMDSIIGLLSNKQYGQTIGMGIVSAMGIDPSSGAGGIAAGLAGRAIQSGISYGVDTITGTRGNVVRASDLLNTDSPLHAAELGIKRKFIKQVESDLKNFEGNKAYSDYAFNSSKMAEQAVANLYKRQHKNATDEEAIKFARENAFGKMMSTQRENELDDVRDSIAGAFLDHSQRNKITSLYDRNGKLHDNLTGDDKQAMMALATSSLASKIAEGMNSTDPRQGFGSMSAGDIAELAKIAIGNSAAGADRFNAESIDRLNNTVHGMARAVENIRDITGKNTSIQDAMKYWVAASGGAAIGAGGATLVDISENIREVSHGAGINAKAFLEQYVAPAKSLFGRYGASLTNSGAAGLALNQVKAFGAGLNTRYSGASADELRNAQAQIMADISNSGEDTVLAASHRAWVESDSYKNFINSAEGQELLAQGVIDANPYSNKTQEYFLKNIVGGARTAEEIAKRAGVSVSAITSKYGDSETQRLVDRGLYSAHIADQVFKDALAYGADAALSDSDRKILDKAKITLGVENRDEISSKLRAHGLSEKEINRIHAKLDRAYSSAGAELGMSGREIEMTAVNRHKSEKTVKQDPSSRSAQGDVVGNALKAETLDQFLNGFLTSTQMKGLEQNTQNTAKALETISELFDSELINAMKKFYNAPKGSTAEKNEKR